MADWRECPRWVLISELPGNCRAGSGDGERVDGGGGRRARAERRGNRRTLIPADLLAEDERIRRLYEQKSAFEKSNQDCARCEIKVDAGAADYRTQVEMVKPGLTLEQAAKLEPVVIARSAFRSWLPRRRNSKRSRSYSKVGWRMPAQGRSGDRPRLNGPFPRTRGGAIGAARHRARRELDFEKARPVSDGNRVA